MCNTSVALALCFMLSNEFHFSIYNQITTSLIVLQRHSCRSHCDLQSSTLKYTNILIQELTKLVLLSVTTCQNRLYKYEPAIIWKSYIS